MVAFTLPGNIAQINRFVRATSWMRDLGTIGNDAHLAGSGDHTPWSTHGGKYGYPTQGQVHAQDVGMSDYMLDLFETFVRRSWRRGELSGIKYMNVLNRHWNIQTWPSWDRAKAGTIQPTYSSDHHLHLSMENGDRDADIMERFTTWFNNGQQFEEDDVTPEEVRNEIKTYFETPRKWWNETDPKPLIEKIYAAEHRTAVLLDGIGELKNLVQGLEEKVSLGGVDPQVLEQAVQKVLRKANEGEAQALES